MIEATEVLQLFVEAGVAFLGFGALVSLFGKSSDSTEAALASARLRCMLELNLTLLVCAVLPFVLKPWLVDELTLWRASCLGPLSIAIWASIVFSSRTHTGIWKSWGKLVGTTPPSLPRQWLPRPCPR